MVFPDYQSVEVPDIRVEVREFWKTDLDPEKGLTVVEIRMLSMMASSAACT